MVKTITENSLLPYYPYLYEIDFRHKCVNFWTTCFTNDGYIQGVCIPLKKIVHAENPHSKYIKLVTWSLPLQWKIFGKNAKQLVWHQVWCNENKCFCSNRKAPLNSSINQMLFFKNQSFSTFLQKKNNQLCLIKFIRSMAHRTSAVRCHPRFNQ